MPADAGVPARRPRRVSWLVDGKPATEDAFPCVFETQCFPSEDGLFAKDNLVRTRYMRYDSSTVCGEHTILDV